MAEIEAQRSSDSERLDSVEEALRRPRAMVIRRDGRVVGANEGVLRLLGLSDLDGSYPPYPHWREADRASLTTMLRFVLSGAADEAEGQPLRLIVRHANGSEIVVDTKFHRVRGGHVCFTHEPVEQAEADLVNGTRVRAALRLLAAAIGETGRTSEKTGPQRWKRIEPDRSLTDREQQVFSLLLEGRRSDKIADALGLSQNTVKHHMNSVFRKCGVTSHVELLARLVSEQERER